jgi:C-terminal processing protease CtpA/Prc
VQKFLSGSWLLKTLEQPDIDINLIIYLLSGLANPGPLREAIDSQVRRALDCDNPVVVANALHMLAGVEGASGPFIVAGVKEKIEKLLGSTDNEVVLQAQRAMKKIESTLAQVPTSAVTYKEAFLDLHATLLRRYPCFGLKQIDFEAIGQQFLPRLEDVNSNEQFGLLCIELIARLEDSHAQLLAGSAKVPQLRLPLWDPGFACLEDDRGQAVVYNITKDSPAERAGVKLGMSVSSINGQSAQDAIQHTMDRYGKYIGYSSRQYLRYHAYRFFVRQMVKGSAVKLEMRGTDGNLKSYDLAATIGARYLPRLPVPIEGINDSGNVSFKLLDGKVGYIYVRRIKRNLIESLDKAVGRLTKAKALIIDVRGNSGGGFDSKRAHLNFTLDAGSATPDRPRFKGPMALLIDSRCISAGEGWASWFVAHERARIFGQPTAGASARKITYTLKNGLYRVRFPVKAYNGYLDRPIERRGLEPHVPIRPRAVDIANARDTVLENARQYLLIENQKSHCHSALAAESKTENRKRKPVLN